MLSDLTGPQGATGVTGPQGVQGATGPQGPAGADGTDGNGIASTTDNGDGTFTLTYDDGSTFTTSDLTGPTGLTGATGATGPAGNSSGGYKTINTLLDQTFSNSSGQTVTGSITSVASNHCKMIYRPRAREGWYNLIVTCYDSNNNVLNLYFEDEYFYSTEYDDRSYFSHNISNNTFFDRFCYASNFHAFEEEGLVDIWADGIIDHIDYEIQVSGTNGNSGPNNFTIKLYTFN